MNTKYKVYHFKLVEVSPVLGSKKEVVDYIHAGEGVFFLQEHFIVPGETLWDYSKDLVLIGDCDEEDK